MSGAGFIARSSPRAYAPGMLRLLACLAAAFALMLAPVAMTGSGGMAMAHGTAAQGASSDGHCGKGRPAPGERKAQLELSCAGACAALAPAPVSTPSPLPYSPKCEAHVPQRLLAGAPPEAETPPPRMRPA